MAVTVIKTTTALAKMVKDPNMSWLDSDELTRIVMANAYKESAWQLQKLANGYWTYPAPLAIFGPTDSSPGFTESGGTPYTLCCASGGSRGTVTLVGAAADTRDSIAVTAMRVDFNAAHIQLLEWIADHRVTQYSQSVGGNSISLETARAELIRQITVLRGVTAG